MLQFVNRNGPSSLMAIARAVKLPYPTTIRIVQTLMHEGMLECDTALKLYCATSLVQTLAVGVHETGHLLQASRPHLVAVTRKHGWPVSITTGAGGNMIVRDSTYAMTSRAFNNYYPGFPLPMLSCAAGYVYIAYLEDDARNCVLDGLEKNEMNKVATEMFHSGALIRRIRSDGYATNDRTTSTLNPGKTSAIAVPVFDNGKIAGVLSLSFFASSMTMPEAVGLYVEGLKEAALAIGKSIEELNESNAVHPMLVNPPTPAATAKAVLEGSSKASDKPLLKAVPKTAKPPAKTVAKTVAKTTAKTAAKTALSGERKIAAA